MAQLNIFNALLLLQEKNADYFKGVQTNIMNFIEINWRPPIHINIKNKKMPKQLRHDIEKLLMPLSGTESKTKDRYAS